MFGTKAVAEIPDRLVPEAAVHAARADADGELLIRGIADALALDADGGIAAVLDWKSDVAPTAETVAGYAQQVRAYMAATGARRGMIVFMTGGVVVEVAEEG